MRHGYCGTFPVARAQKKFLLVAVDYFPKWVEAEPLARITEKEVLKFLWKNIICMFEVSKRLISDNGRQFQGKEITSRCQEMKITQSFTSVAYPQENGQRETPFNLVYGSKEVLPVEIGQSSARVEYYPDNNYHKRAMELDLLEDKRNRDIIQMKAYRSQVMRAYNKRVQVQDFQIGDQELKKFNTTEDVGNLESRWEEPFKIIRRVSSGAFYLENAQGRPLKITWNVFHLKNYYA
ncbi:uncharacterized protein [Primulina eburnea]|uniref:uncharacterized protein n=1 Tax=Primulina eburnea TaxID=1245227 RepID=UPI003C6C1A5F